jgi:predicted RNase H-like HicB family nuclease
VKQTFKAIVKKNGRWWIGWVEEVPGVNSQGRTRKALRANLQSALTEALEINRTNARAAIAGAYEEEALTV